MKLNPIASNMTELALGNRRILFSYKTPVAYYDPIGGFFKTDKYYSPTTTRHIKKWMNGAKNVGQVPQETIEAIVDVA